MAPKVVGLIVNWNGRHHLEQCLPSLQQTSYPNQQWVVLDNGSTDGSQTWLKQHYPTAQVKELGFNRGFTGANNVGMQMALAENADYVVLLNNDTRVEPDWLDALVATAEADPAIAICQARQRSWDGQEEIHFRFIPEWAEAGQVRLPIQLASAPQAVPFASGCAMLLRCDALRQIGLFDERYFMYVEDVDLTLRAWVAGYRVMEVPNSTVYHRMTGSDSRSQQRIFWGYRNQLTTIFKVYQFETIRRFLRPISKRWFLTSNRFALRGTLAAMGMLLTTLSMRRTIQHRRVEPDGIFLGL